MVPWLHMYLYASEQMSWYDMWYEWMMSAYTINMIEIKLEYMRLKRNQGIEIAYEFMWYDWNEVSMSEMKYVLLKWTKNDYDWK